MTNHGRVLSANPAYPNLGALANSKAGVIVGNHLVWNTVANTAVTTLNQGRGKVAIITRLVGSSQGLIPGVATTGTAPFFRSAGSPTTTGDNLSALVFDDGDGATTNRSLKFFNFDRNESVFLVGTPLVAGIADLVAPPDIPVDWQPRHPIMVPSELITNSTQASSSSGGLTGYGYIVDEQTAQSMGFDPVAGPHGTAQRLVMDGQAITNGVQDLVVAKTGQSICILDLYVRLQPKSVAGTATITLKDGDGNVLFKFRNDNRANCKEWKFSPEFYLPASKKLTVTGDAQSSGRGSVAIIAKYVDASDVPPNFFYSYSTPTHASPSATTVATVGKRATTTFTLTYPRTGNTATTPGQGKRHHVEGILFSANKDNTLTSDLAIAWVSTGTSTSSTVGLGGALSVTAANKALMPPQALGFPMQTVSFLVDQVNIPCVANTGLILFETFAIAGTGIGTPAATDTDVADWGVTVWGRTLPTEQSTTDLRQFTGE